MGLGVLEDTVAEFVPGTTRYFDDPDRPQIATAEHAGLKCDTSGPVPIILVPQPSDNPNDPLNWPLWKRDAILVVLSIVSIFATSLGPILAANTIVLSRYFTRLPTKVALLTGWYLLGVGVAGAISVPSARVWGKRHLYLLGTVILIASSAWGGACGGGGLYDGTSRRYTSLLWARIFQGVGTAPFEALVNVSVGDLYFVHERGKRMAFANLAVFGGAFFTPIVVGKITAEMGWRWTFYFEAIFCAMCLPLVFFLVPETDFRRSAHLNIDLAASENIAFQEHKQIATESTTPPARDMQSAALHAGANGGDEELLRDNPNSIAKKSYVQMLLPFDGRKLDESYWKLFLRPFPLFAQPAVLWACVIQGAMIGWTVFIGIVFATSFLGPPNFWGEVETGYTYTGAFVGALLGFLIAGALADWSAKFMTNKNNGVYEPEFRIILVIPQLVFGSIGLYGFGITTGNLSKYHWIVPIIFFSFQVGGMVIGAVAAALYIVDAHRDIAIEAFTCILIFKNFFSFGLTFSAFDWLAAAGQEKVFLWIASVQIVICLFSIPMYVLGKRNRSFFHRHNILKALGLL